ncbi:hypothetical protein Tco_0783599 [Tanacetum coccineum]
MASLDHRLNPLFSIKECMTCGALYTADFCCSKGGLEDKILVPKPPQNCATCGNPVNGLNCRSCAFVRKCLNEGWYTIHDENKILNTSESSNHNTNVSCGNGAHIGYNCPPKAPIISNPEQCNQTIDKLPQTLPSVYPTCNSGDENSFTYDSKPNSVDDSLNRSKEFAGELAPILPGMDEDEFDEEEDDCYDDDTSSDDDSFENIDYVEASPPDSELVSLEEDENIEPDQGGLTSVVISNHSNDHLLELPKFESFHFNFDPSFPRPPPEPPDVEICLHFEPDAPVIDNFNELRAGGISSGWNFHEPVNTSLHTIDHEIGTRKEKERVVLERERRERK